MYIKRKFQYNINTQNKYTIIVFWNLVTTVRTILSTNRINTNDDKTFTGVLRFAHQLSWWFSLVYFMCRPCTFFGTHIFDFFTILWYCTIFSTWPWFLEHVLTNFANIDFSKRRSLTSTNPAFSLFSAHFRYFGHISWHLNIIVTYYNILTCPPFLLTFST